MGHNIDRRIISQCIFLFSSLSDHEACRTGCDTSAAMKSTWMWVAVSALVLVAGQSFTDHIRNSKFSSRARESAFLLSQQLCQQNVADRTLLRFSQWSFANDTVLHKLPVDPERKNYVRKVSNAIFSSVLPTPLNPPPALAAIADAPLVDLLDLDPCDCASSAQLICGLCWWELGPPNCHPTLTPIRWAPVWLLGRSAGRRKGHSLGGV